MRYLSFLLFSAVIAAILWPYVTVFRLSSAISENDIPSLNVLLDMPAIQRNYEATSQASLPDLSQLNGNNSALGTMLQNGLEHLNKAIVEHSIDVNWAVGILQPHNHPESLFQRFSFGFFESPTRFMVRLGELGQHPTHFYMTWQDWQWRVVAIY